MGWISVPDELINDYIDILTCLLSIPVKSHLGSYWMTHWDFPALAVEAPGTSKMPLALFVALKPFPRISVTNLTLCKALKPIVSQYS